MQQRLELFLKEEGLSKSEFAEKINVSKAIVSHIISGRNQPGRKFIINTMAAFPNLNIDWLLHGKGEMYGNNASVQKNDSFSTDLFNGEVRTSKTSRTVPNKSIRKIIVLYDDNSFEEFS